MTLAWLLLVPVLFAGCLTAATTAYETSVDERTVATQAADTKIATTVRKRITDFDTKGLLAVDVYCYQGLVVIAGVVPPESLLRAKAPEIARGVEGVKRVDTYYVASSPSKVADVGIGARIKARLVGDGQLKASQVDWSVLGGHVVLVGVVDSSEKLQKIVGHVRSIDGVAAVKSFVQVKPPAPK
jgi:osmotically-inducible protein OsmY